MVKERLSSVENISHELEFRIQREAEKYKGVPIALSGGIDSSTLASYLDPEFAISVRLPGGERFNETQYSQIVAENLDIKQFIVTPNPDEFEDGIRQAVEAIGKPTPHFNIFPLWAMYRELSKMGVHQVILADGPDETMCGYARNLITKYLYDVQDYGAFRHYGFLIGKAIPEPYKVYAKLVDRDEEEVKKLMDGYPLIMGMNRVDMVLKRPEMDNMSDGIAASFGIKNIRPYQDNDSFDNWQFILPDEAKIHEIEFGKYALRLVASRRIPHDLAWRKTKIGGPVYPVNQQMGWVKTDGEFGKAKWMEYQQKILDGNN